MGYKIIVADDSPSAQKLIQMAFSAAELDVIPFNDGQQVMDSLSQINPDAIVLNLSLPQKTGYELGEYIRGREEFDQVPLVLLKESFEPVDKERLETFEYDELVQKPFDSEALAQKLQAFIEARKVPNTLPEEPVWREKSTAELKVELDENIRDMVKHEVLEVERELEKRIKAKLLAELKMWLIDNQKK
jgi:DNA-binding response OmpR family regulator